MSAKLGMEAKLYHNTGTYAVPVWTEITNVKDLTLALERAEADVTTRANGGWRAFLAALREGNIEFEMVWDTADAGFTVIKDAFLAAGTTTIDMAVMDGDIGVAGAEGLRAHMTVLNMSRAEPLEEAIMASVTLKVAYASAAEAPVWLVTT